MGIQTTFSSHRQRLRLWFITALLVLVALIFLVPLLWMLSSSLKPNYQIFAVPPQWILIDQNPATALSMYPKARYRVVVHRGGVWLLRQAG